MKLKLEAILVFRKFELFMCLRALKKINERLSNTIKYDQLKLRVKVFILFCFMYISFISFFLFFFCFPLLAFIYLLSFFLFTSFVGSCNSCLAGVSAIPRINPHGNNIYLVKLVPSKYTSRAMWVIPIRDLVDQAEVWILILISHQKLLDWNTQREIWPADCQWRWSLVGDGDIPRRQHLRWYNKK